MRPDRSPRDDITAQQRADAVKAVLSGAETERAVAARLGVHHQAVQRWRKDYLASLVKDPRMPTVADFAPADDVPIGQDDERERSDEALSRYVYDAIVAQLQAVTNRARITGRADFIERQTGDHLAHLDQVAWDQIVRLVQTFAWTRDSERVANERGLPDGVARGRTVDAAD